MAKSDQDPASDGFAFGLAPGIRIRIEVKCWIWICIEANADPQHCFYRHCR